MKVERGVKYRRVKKSSSSSRTGTPDTLTLNQWSPYYSSSIQEESRMVFHHQASHKTGLGAVNRAITLEIYGELPR